jgi:hypothetical protein
VARLQGDDDFECTCVCASGSSRADIFGRLAIIFLSASKLIASDSLKPTDMSQLPVHGWLAQTDPEEAGQIFVSGVCSWPVRDLREDGFRSFAPGRCARRKRALASSPSGSAPQFVHQLLAAGAMLIPAGGGNVRGSSAIEMESYHWRKRHPRTKRFDQKGKIGL